MRKPSKKSALRKAKKERLREEEERLFLGDPESCGAYASILGSRLPGFLEDSVCDVFDSSLAAEPDPEENIEYDVAYWILAYLTNCGGLSDRMESMFFRCVCSNMGDRYGFASSVVASYLNHRADLPEEYENIIWANGNVAVDYAISNCKRIPSGIEEGVVLNNMNSDEFANYCNAVFRGKAPENIERAIVDRHDLCLSYAQEVLFGPLPGFLHSAMTMKSFGDQSEQVSEYFEFIKETRKFVVATLVNFDKNATVKEVLEELGSA